MRAGSTQAGGGIHGAQGDGVVDAEEAGDVRTPGGQLPEAMLTAFKAKFGDILEQGFLIGDFRLLEGTLIAGQLAEGGFWPGGQITNEADPLMARLQQVRRGAESGIITVGRDDGDSFRAV